MSGTLLGFITVLADALAPETVRVAAAKADSHAGTYVAALAAASAAVTSAAVLVWRRRRRRGAPNAGGREERL